MAWLAGEVSRGQIRWVLVEGGAQSGPRLPGDTRTGSKKALAAAAEACQRVTLGSSASGAESTTASGRGGGAGGESALYDCRGPRGGAAGEVKITRVRILVVDDDRAVRDALRRALTLAGYEVQLAEDGEQALELVVQAVPDAVVLDVGMPGIDGLEVCRALRRLGNRVPILMLTARDAVADRIDGLDVGADDYMVKPFDVGELKARIRALLRRAGPEAGDPEAVCRSRRSGWTADGTGRRSMGGSSS